MLAAGLERLGAVAHWSRARSQWFVEESRGALVLLALGYHHACALQLRRLRDGRATRSHVWYRWFNELPVLMLVAAVVLVVVKPF